jgi:hypothetical protein
LFKQVSITILELVAIVNDDISCKFMVRKDEPMLDYNLFMNFYNRENTIGEGGQGGGIATSISKHPNPKFMLYSITI